jgi:hypothetical protein
MPKAIMMINPRMGIQRDRAFGGFTAGFGLVSVMSDMAAIILHVFHK